MIFVYWQWKSLNLILAHKVAVSIVSSSSQFHPQRWGETAILKEMHPTGRIILENFLFLSIPTERTWIGDSGAMTAIRQSTFYWLELISMSVVLMLRQVPHFNYFKEWIPCHLMETDEHILPSVSPNSPSLFAPSLPPAKFCVKIRQTKLEDQDCKLFSFNFTVWFQLQTDWNFFLGGEKSKPIHVWQFWCLFHISKISLTWKNNRNNNHSLMNMILILVYRKIGSRQDFTIKKGTSQ